jgi:hypothetical protein
MERTAIPPRVKINHLRTLVRQKRDEGLATITLMLDDVDSMIIECELYRTKHDAAARRQRDGGRARRQSPPKVTLENVDRTTTTQAGHEPANELAVLTVTGLASTIDPDDLLRRDSEIFEPASTDTPGGH